MVASGLTLPWGLVHVCWDLRAHGICPSASGNWGGVRGMDLPEDQRLGAIIRHAACKSWCLKTEAMRSISAQEIPIWSAEADQVSTAWPICAVVAAVSALSRSKNGATSRARAGEAVLSSLGLTSVGTGLSSETGESVHSQGQCPGRKTHRRPILECPAVARYSEHRCRPGNYPGFLLRLGTMATGRCKANTQGYRARHFPGCTRTRSRFGSLPECRAPNIRQARTLTPCTGFDSGEAPAPCP